MNNEERIKNAFISACKYIQKHPPTELDMSDIDQIKACIGCNTYEEGWKQWAAYFLKISR
jgi:hypothetical protein